MNDLEVTPLAGVWIEIAKRVSPITANASLPLRECGLKLPIIVKVLG